MTNLAIQTRLIEFLRSVTGQESLAADTDLFDAGATDSLTIMDMLVFIETGFHVRLGFDDLTPEAFKTPQSLAELIVRKLASRAQLDAA
jgi:acyl carrier protein